jgi:hypothetical protein
MAQRANIGFQLFKIVRQRGVEHFHGRHHIIQIVEFPVIHCSSVSSLMVVLVMGGPEYRSALHWTDNGNCRKRLDERRQDSPEET